ncbi:MAG TPA: hypothetical protein VMM14_01975 [Acidimicrobiia bacterium]|nr:hypothetical protein [Acidimicrobiia bacterium]
MATEERVMALLAEANPVPDVEVLPLTRVAGSEYLVAIDQRSSDMLETETRDERTGGERRPPRTTLSMAAAAILILGTLGLFLLNRGDDDVAAGIAVAQELAAAVSSGTTDLDGLVTEDATFGPMTVPLDEGLAAFWAGLETEITLTDCGQSARVVRCGYEWTDAVRRAQDRPEYGSMTFLIEDSLVAGVSRTWDDETSGWLSSGDPVIHYLQWLNENHPGWDQGLSWIGEPGEIGPGYAPLSHDDPAHDAAYAAALTQHLDEYSDQLAEGQIDLPPPAS